MEQYLETLSLPIIAAAVYWLVASIKIAVNNNEVFKRFIPLLACVLGAGLGIAAYFFAPSLMPAHNLFSAMIVGGASGLSATGANQIIKQITKEECKCGQAAAEPIIYAETAKAADDAETDKTSDAPNAETGKAADAADAETDK